MKMSFYILIGGAVFALGYLAQAFFGISIGSTSTSSLEPTGFVASRFLLQTALGAGVGLLIGAVDRWRSRRRGRDGQE